MNDREDKGRKITLGELIGDLKEGTPGISLYTEDKRNIVVPGKVLSSKQLQKYKDYELRKILDLISFCLVSPLDYGPFSSFAPRYDSTWATLTKDDSKLLLSTYGDQTAAQYAQRHGTNFYLGMRCKFNSSFAVCKHM